MNYRAITIISFLGIILLTSCQTYRQLELEPQAVFDEVERRRSIPLPLQSSLSFKQAATQMEKHSPELTLVRKEYEGWQRAAGFRTPLPNPGLTAGPAFGSNLESGAANSVQPFVALGFSIPLGPRLIRNDELYDVRESQAYNETVARHRDLFFKLRRAYLEYAGATVRLQGCQGLSQTIQDTRKTTKRLVEIGSISPMGLTEVEVEAGEIEMAKIQAELDRASAAAALGRLMGVDTAQITQLTPQATPSKLPLPSLIELRKSLLENNTQLSRTQMSFKVCDAELRLELAEQYPDLRIGVDVEDEVGDTLRTVAVPVEVDLPIFDRNQREIAMANNKRELALLSYQAELSNLLGELEEAHARLQLIERKLELYDRQVIPAAKKSLEAGKREMELGAIDVLRYLDLSRRLRALELEQLKLATEHIGAFVRIEGLVGSPLVEFD